LFKWLHVGIPDRIGHVPDRNRYVSDRVVPFPISRNIDFVFPSAFPVPAPVPDMKKQEQEWEEGFPDRSRSFSSLPKIPGFRQKGKNRTHPILEGA
jgi:hypothetical protein